MLHMYVLTYIFMRICLYMLHVHVGHAHVVCTCCMHMCMHSICMLHVHVHMRSRSPSSINCLFDCFIDGTFVDGAPERQMGCSSSKSPEDVGATPNQPVDGEPGNAIKKGARIVILGAAAGSKYPRGRPATVLRA